MNTKTIFKTLALAMMMPAMLLTTACSSDDDVVNNNQNTAGKGYTLPVTVKVTRQGDEGTRATYNSETRKLEFSAGDKLFVEGHDESGGPFAGTLTYVSDGNFSGNIATLNEWNSVDDLFNHLDDVIATLLPAGYESYGFLVIESYGQPYTEYLDNDNYGLAVAADKATAIEQFSLEQARAYIDGFALAPQNAIVNFTYKNDGMAAGATWSPVLANKTKSAYYGGSVEMTFDEGGISTFAIAVEKDTDGSEWTLTYNNSIEVSLGNKALQPGNIYNWTNVPAPASPYASLTAEDVGKIIGADGNVYADAAAVEAGGTTALALIAYVGAAGSADASSATYKGLGLALTDANSGNKCAWCSQPSQSAVTCMGNQYDASTNTNDMAGIANTEALIAHDTHTHAAATAARNYNSGTHPTGTSAWFLPSAGQWKKMIDAAGGYATLQSNASLSENRTCWSSTENEAGKAWAYEFFLGGSWYNYPKYYGNYVRAVFAF